MATLRRTASGPRVCPPATSRDQLGDHALGQRHVGGTARHRHRVAAHVHVGRQAVFEGAQILVGGTQQAHDEVGRNSHAGANRRASGCLAGRHVVFEACFLGFSGHGVELRVYRSSCVARAGPPRGEHTERPEGHRRGRRRPQHRRAEPHRGGADGGQSGDLVVADPALRSDDEHDRSCLCHGHFGQWPAAPTRAGPAPHRRTPPARRSALPAHRSTPARRRRGCRRAATAGPPSGPPHASAAAPSRARSPSQRATQRAACQAHEVVGARLGGQLDRQFRALGLRDGLHDGHRRRRSRRRPALQHPGPTARACRPRAPHSAPAHRRRRRAPAVRPAGFGAPSPRGSPRHRRRRRSRRPQGWRRRRTAWRPTGVSGR